MRLITLILISTLSLQWSLQSHAKSQFTLPPDEDTTHSDLQPSILATATKIVLKISSPKTSYRLGDKMSITISSNTECYLTVLDFSTSGNANILFPNAHQTNNLLPANHKITIPNHKFDIKISGETGVEQLWAVCKIENTPPFTPSYDFSRSVFYSLGKTAGFKSQYRIPPSYDAQQEAWVQLSIGIGE